MNDFQKAIDTITKAFEEFAAKLKEMADTLNKAFGLSVPEKEKKKSLSCLLYTSPSPRDRG